MNDHEHTPVTAQLMGDAGHRVGYFNPGYCVSDLAICSQCGVLMVKYVATADDREDDSLAGQTERDT